MTHVISIIGLRELFAKHQHGEELTEEELSLVKAYIDHVQKRIHTSEKWACDKDFDSVNKEAMEMYNIIYVKHWGNRNEDRMFGLVKHGKTERKD